MKGFPSGGAWGPMLFFRNVGAVAIAAVLCSVPEAGPNRFLLAAFLVFVCVPAATWMEWKYPVADNGWSEPLFDLTVLVTAIHLVPTMWFPALVIGLIIVQAPSVSESELSSRFHALFAAILTVGMGFAAWLHDVEGWELPVLAMVVLYPSVIFYSHRQNLRANEIRDNAKALTGLRLVAGGVAHDFNNTLMSVMGNAEAAQRELDPAHPARTALDEVLHGAQRASLLSARLLAFSGDRSQGEESLDLEEEVRDLAALMQAAVPKGVEIRVESALAGERVRADRAKLQQVMMNLMLNAGEATVGSGVVRVALREIQEAGDDSAGRVEIRVIDRGVGMSPEESGQVFEPHFTLKTRGHGLGLASAPPLLREMGGHIEIRSRVGVGTEACIVLPSEPAAIEAPPAEIAAPRAAEPVEHAPQPGGLALVVDDERPVRTAIARMLRNLGYQVEEATDGAAAIDCVAQRGEALRLVVLDILMPGMDGRSCLRAIREAAPELPVLLCSGYDPSSVDPNADDPWTQSLPKPFGSDELRAAIAALGSGPRRRRARRPAGRTGAAPPPWVTPTR